jgi:hypothetical protein
MCFKIKLLISGEELKYSIQDKISRKLFILFIKFMDYAELKLQRSRPGCSLELKLEKEGEQIRKLKLIYKKIHNPIS